jgi:hypothetical protein
MKLHKCLVVIGLIGASLVFVKERGVAQNVSAQKNASDKRDG